MIVGLALETHIPPDVWARQEPEAILTALEMLDEQKHGSDQTMGGGTDDQHPNAN